MIRTFRPVLALCLFGIALTPFAHTQTQVDLSSQAKRVDFSNASSTKPVKTGTMLPATCVTGEMYLKTDAPAGGNLYVCAATDTWTAQGGGSFNPLPGSAHGQFLGWDSGTATTEWFSFGSLFGLTGRTVDLATEVIPQYATGITPPSSCTQWGLLFFDTDAPAGTGLYYCDGATYEQVNAAVPASSPFDPFGGSEWLIEPFAGGDPFSDKYEVGALGWSFGKSGGVINLIGDPGVVRLNSGGVNGDYAYIITSEGSSKAGYVLDARTWKWLWRTRLTSTTGTWIGLVGFGDRLGEGIYAKADPGTSANWLYCLESLSTESCVDSGAALTAGSFANISAARSAGGTITFSVDGAGTKTFCASGCDGTLANLTSSFVQGLAEADSLGSTIYLELDRFVARIDVY